MSEESKFRLMKVTGLSLAIADVLEAAMLTTPKDIKLADDADLEAAGLTKDEIKIVRAKCPAFKASKE